MISSENNHLPSHNINSPEGEDESNCGGSISPSSLRDSHSRASTNEHNISQHSLHDDIAPPSPSLANISTNIELHPQNNALGGSSSHKFIKRPLNAYMIWTRQERKRILTDDPKMKMNEVSKAIQMGEKWKKMSDKEKKPYFEMAKKFSEEHKLVLQEHPELQYAPSKKKVVKKLADGKQLSVVDSSSVKSCTITPDASRSTTPRGSSSNLVTPQPMSQNQMFSPFQSPLASSTVQLAQVLQGVRSVTSQAAISSNSSVQNPLLGSASTFPQAFLQSHSLPQRVANSSVSFLGGISQANGTSTGVATRTTPSQMLDLYYTSLCQPAFPSVTENPVNPLGLYPSHYLLEQYNQQLTQQQQQQQGGSTSNANASTNGGGGRF